MYHLRAKFKNWHNSIESYVLHTRLKKKRLKMTQVEKERFIKMNESKLTRVELFPFFHFNSVAANVFELFCVPL